MLISAAAAFHRHYGKLFKCNSNNNYEKNNKTTREHKNKKKTCFDLIFVDVGQRGKFN